MAGGTTHGNIIVGLDVGTTKICVVVGEVINNKIEILGVSSSPSTGLRKGVVVNIEATVNSIRKAVETAESVSGVEINSVYVGISGGHIKGINSIGVSGVRGKEVTNDDVERVIDSAKAVYVPLDREVLHVIPTGYSIDGLNGIKDPVGMIGTRLEAKVYILTGAITSVQNLLKCCEKAGLEVIDIVFEPLASAEAILTEEEKELGVAVVDIGGGTTDVILYRDGWLRHTSVLAVGGNHFTNDIAVGLGISINEAEKIKKKYGHAVLTAIDEYEEIKILRSGEIVMIPRLQLCEIIYPRTEELIDIINNELKACSGYEIASSGVVLTGGGSLLSGIDVLAADIFKLPVRIGMPSKIYGQKEITGNPMYSTGIGLVLYGYNVEREMEIYPATFTGIFGKMKEWVKGIFR
ncbi:MAG: cell division protein FtsA [Nitrospirae bacterium]|jgi:cell division protein FtsA|nr:cell division protein FtsA [Nitrospirota bacterium]